MAAKQWIKKKQPSFDGDVYVENVKCVLSLTEEEKEKRKCRVNGEGTDFQQKASGSIVSAVPDVPERTGIVKRLIGRYVGDLQSDLSVGKCGCAVPVYDDGHGKVGRG